MPDRDVETAPREAGWRGAGFYLGAIITGLFLVRLLGATWSSHFPAVWPDATFANEGYLAVAAKSPFRPSFYNAFRPIGYPFLLWIVGRNTQLTVLAQAALYCAGVGALITTALRVMQSRALGVITALLIAGVALQVVGAAVAVRAVWNWEQTRVVLTTDKLFVVHGTLRKRAAAVRLARIGAVEIEQGLLGRLLGYGTIVAGDLEIEYVPEPRRVYGLVERLSA